MFRFARRDVDLSKSTTFDKVNLAFGGAGAVAGLVLCILSIVAMTRSNGSRSPYTVLFLATLTYIISECTTLGQELEAYDTDPITQAVIALEAVPLAMSGWTIALILASAFHLLWSRALARGVNYQVGRKIAEWIGISLLMFCGAIAAILEGAVASELLVTASIDRLSALNLLNTATYVGYAQMGVMGILLFDFFFSGLVIHSNSKDKAVALEVGILIPLMFIQLGFSMFSAIFPRVTPIINTNTTAMIGVITNGVFFVVPVATMSLLVGIGMSARQRTYSPNDYGESQYELKPYDVQQYPQATYSAESYHNYGGSR